MIGSGNSNPVLPDKRYWFKPGQSGNPGGTAAGTRKRLTGNFLRCLEEHFAEHGKSAIQRLYEEDPRAYVGAIVKLCPRELEVNQAFEGIDNEEMRFVMALAKQYIQARQAQKTQLLEAQLVAAAPIESVP